LINSKKLRVIVFNLTNTRCINLDKKYKRLNEIERKAVSKSLRTFLHNTLFNGLQKKAL